MGSLVVTIVSWAALFLPGYALVRRFCPRDLDQGVLHVLALAYLATFALLSPFSILGYVLGLPLWSFSAVVVLAVVAGGVVLAQQGALRELVATVRSESWLGLVGFALLGVLLFLQVRLGAHMQGDAYVHVGRIRRLLEYGFENRDIYLAEPYFHHIYHTNFLYALYASIAQLNAQSYLDSWFSTQPVAKLLVASGLYSFGFAITRRREVGWLFAITVVTASSAEDYSLYPNGLAAGFVLPTLLGVGFSLLEPQGVAERPIAKLALFAFVLGQIHALYALHAGLMLSAPLLALAASARVRRQSARLPLLGLLSLLAAAPFLLVSKYAFVPDAQAKQAARERLEVELELPPRTPRSAAAPARRPKASTPALLAGGGHLEKQLDTKPSGEPFFPPSQMGGVTFVATGFASLLLACGLARARLRVLLGVTASAGILALVLFVPEVTAVALRVLHASFAVARLSTSLSLFLFLGLCACAVELAGRLQRDRIVQPLLLIASFGVATQLLGHAPRSFAEQWHLAFEGRAVRHASLDTVRQRKQLLERHVPKGAVVLAAPRWAREIVMVCDCFVLAADRGHTHVPDMPVRQHHLEVLNAPRTPWAIRSALLSHHGIRHVVYDVRRERAYAWARDHGRVLGRAGGIEVVKLEGLSVAPRARTPRTGPR